VFQNARLLVGLTARLEAEGLAVLSHRLVPTNDGGIALGQAVVAGVDL
jgi:hydrogenase maturation protein HypF